MKLSEIKNGCEVYDMENGYKVIKEECSWIKRGFKIRFWNEGDDFLPDIYDCVDYLNNSDQSKEFDFQIQTTSYGALSLEDIEKVIKGLQVAMDTIKEVEATFKRQ